MRDDGSTLKVLLLLGMGVVVSCCCGVEEYEEGEEENEALCCGHFPVTSEDGEMGSGEGMSLEKGGLEKGSLGKGDLGRRGILEYMRYGESMLMGRRIPPDVLGKQTSTKRNRQSTLRGMKGSDQMDSTAYYVECLLDYSPSQ